MRRLLLPLALCGCAHAAPEGAAPAAAVSAAPVVEAAPKAAGPRHLRAAAPHDPWAPIFVAVDDDGDVVAITDHAKVCAWRGDTMRSVPDADVARIDATGERLAIYADGTLRLFDLRRDRVLAAVPWRGTPNDLAWVGDRVLIVGDVHTGAFYVDLSGARERARDVEYNTRFLTGNERAMVAARSHAISHWLDFFRDGRVVASLENEPVPDQGASVGRTHLLLERRQAFDPDHPAQTAVYGYRDGIRVDVPEEIAHPTAVGAGAGTFLLGMSDGTVVVTDESFATKAKLSGIGAITAVHRSPNGRWIAVMRSDATIQVVRAP